MSESAYSVKGIDHLIVMVRDLNRSERAWRALGFTTTPRGFHQTGGTANHLIMLDRTYIELLGLADPTSVSPYRGEIEEAPGLAGIAFRGTAQGTFDLWHSRGLHPAVPSSLARAVDIAGKNEQARFRLTMLERSPGLPFILFCCEHLTPQFVWRADAQPHPNGARGIKELVVVVDDAATREGFEHITGRTAATVAEGNAAVSLEDSRISFLSEAAFLRRFGPSVKLSRRKRPTLAGFVLESSDLEQARQFAQSAGWSIQPTASGFVAQGADDDVVIEWTA